MTKSQVNETCYDTHQLSPHHHKWFCLTCIYIYTSTNIKWDRNLSSDGSAFHWKICILQGNNTSGEQQKHQDCRWWTEKKAFEFEFKRLLPVHGDIHWSRCEVSEAPGFRQVQGWNQEMGKGSCHLCQAGQPAFWKLPEIGLRSMKFLWDEQRWSSLATLNVEELHYQQ